MHPIRERAQRSKTETWSRQDLEHLFGVGRATAQTIMKAIGDIQSVGAAHFIDRSSLLSFLDDMIAAGSADEAMRKRLLEAEAPPARKPLRVSLPADSRNTRVHELPKCIRISPGRLEITASTAVDMLESLVLLGEAMQNDLDSFERAVRLAEPASEAVDDGLRAMFERVRTC